MLLQMLASLMFQNRESAKKAVNALKAAGINKGYLDGTFGYGKQITRGELALWIQRGFDLKASTDEVSFPDVQGQYTDAVKALVKAEVTKGYADGTF